MVTLTSESDPARPDAATGTPPDVPTDAGKRTFIKVAAVASGILAAAGAGSIVRSLISPAGPPAAANFPKVKVTNVTTLAVGSPLLFDYPLKETPNVLVKLGVKATDGVGPDGDIVAFSVICQHLGCIYAVLAPGEVPPCPSSYRATEPVGYCCCHGSIFDLANGAKVIGGPSPRPQPQVQLVVDAAGDIYAVGMGPPTIFGHNTGSDDVSFDLQGGTLVG